MQLNYFSCRENVCIEREETNDDDDESSEEENDDKALNEDKKNETKHETQIPNFFSTSISLSNCHQTPNKYECITK